MTTYFKATRPDGTDFRTGTIQYTVGGVTRHPNYKRGSVSPASYLSVSTSETDCIGFQWPGRLFEVEAVGDTPWVPDHVHAPNKRAVEAVRVIRELPSWRLFGLNGHQVVRYLEILKTLTDSEWIAINGFASVVHSEGITYFDIAVQKYRRLYRNVAYPAADAAIEVVAEVVALDIISDSNPAKVVADVVALALIARYHISEKEFAILTAPMRAVGIDFDTRPDGKWWYNYTDRRNEPDESNKDAVR